METDAVFGLGFSLFMLMFGLLYFVLLVVSLIWAYSDAEARGKPGCLVVLLIFLLGWPISLLVWLVFRPEKPGYY